MSALLHHLQSRRLECLCIWDMAVEKMSQFMVCEELEDFWDIFAGLWDIET